MDSHQKITAAIDDWADSAQNDGSVMGAALVALKPMAMLQLPTDPDELDDALEDFARRLLELRSDDAPELGIYAIDDGLEPTPAEVDAAVAESELAP